MDNILETSGYPQLLRAIRYVRGRWRLRNILRGLAFVVLFGLAAFAVSAYGMEYFRYTAWSVRLFRIFTYVALLAIAIRFIVRPLAKRVTNEQVALYMEEHDPSLKEAISSAVEMGQPAEEGTGASPYLSKALIQKLVEQTVERCESIDYGHGIERDALKRSSAVLFAVAVAGMIGVLLSPGFLRYGASLLLNPMRSAQAASPYMILVAPGDIGVARGADQLVTAELQGFEAEDTEISVKATDEADWQRFPMNFEQDDGRYSFMMFDLGAATEYFVEANGVRSDLYRIDVSDLPYVKQIDLEYRFPDYTGLSPQSVEDGGDIAALRGTEVALTIQPTVKVAGGVLKVEGAEPIPLEPSAEGAFTASLTVREDAFYRIELEAFDGTMRAASPDYAIEVLSDQPPSVNITKPGRDSKVNPIEEVFTEIQGEDDYGLSKVELVYSVNGGEEQVVRLHSGRGKREVVAGHTFFLEEFDLTPGDFISYYARATDGDIVAGPQTSTTDIYFIEARPFDRRYSQAQGGMPGGGGGGGMEGTLSVRQREIVAATFKLIRDKAKYSRRDWEENLTTVALMQGRLREQVENLIRRMTNRGITGMDGDFATISESLQKALKEMGPAEEKLTAKDPDAAMPYEQRALQHLQRADAVFRDVQVSFQQGGGGGGGQAASAEDLADLFELELDKLRNQYETVQRGQQQSLDNEVDEALQRLQELARRQQQENERLKRQANRLQNQMGGGGGGSQRDLAEQTEELARRLERLAREQSQPDLQDTARRLQQAADAMRRAGARGDDGAIAQGLSALDRLKDARRLLDKNRSVRLERDMEDALEQAERIRQQQERVKSDVESLGAEGRGASDRLQRIFERKDELAEQVASLETQLDRMARDSRGEQKEASREIQEAANSIRDSKLKEKIRYSKGVVQGRSPEYAENFENVIGEDIDSLHEQLKKASGSIGKSEESQVTEAIEKTRDLVRNLQSLSERIRERQEEAARGLNRDRAGQQQGQEGQPGEQGQPGQEGQQGQEGQGQGQSSEQAGQQGQGSESQSGEGQGAAQGEQRGLGSRDGYGGGANIGAGSPYGPRYQPGTFSTEELRQLRREFQERVGDAEQLRRELARQDLDVPDLSEIIRRMEEFDKKQIYLNPLGLEQLDEDVLTNLKQFEYWLRRELEDMSEGELFLAGADQVPPDYRKLVEEYFRSLSR
jgi:molybdenum-dependent DNA-binding transcriptional regulator ModE